MMHRLTGAVTLFRLFLRLDRIKLPLWLLGVAFMIAITPISIRDVTETEAVARGVAPEVILAEQAAIIEANPAMVALSGPADALDTFGGRYIFELGAITLAIIGLMNALLVARHTRASEEAGRTELLRSGVVGSWANEFALGVLAVVVNTVVGVVIVVAFAGDGLDLARSAAFAVGIGLMGLAFAAISLVWSQVFEHSRSSTGASIATIAVAYAVRAAGDVQTEWVSLLSPIGMAQAVNPFGEIEATPLVLLVVTVAAAVGVAAWLSGRRDVGAGLVAPRPGPPAAAGRLLNPLGLAWRLQRSMLMWWVIGVAFLGMVYGSVLSAIDDFLEDNESMRDLLEQMGAAGDQFRDAFLTMLLTILGFIAAAAVVHSALRPRSEETAGHAEVTLATTMSRSAWLGSHVVLSWVVAPVLMVVAALALTTADAVIVGHFTDTGGAITAALARVPALWAMIGVTVLLYGLSSKLAVWGWAVFGVTVVVFLFGELLRIPDIGLNLSLLYHTNHQPVESQPVLSLVVLTVIAAATTAAGFRLLLRRDIG